VNSFRNMPVGRKFLWTFGIECALCALLGGIALTGMMKVNQSTSRLAETALPSAQQLSQMRVAIQLSRRSDMGIMLCDSATCLQYYVERRQKIWPSFENAYAVYSKLAVDPQERAMVDTVRSNFRSYLDSSDATVALLMAGSKDKAGAQLVGANAKIYRSVDEAINTAIDKNTVANQQECKEASATYQSVRSWVLLLIGLTLLISIYVGWVLTRAIVPPLLKATGVLKSVAEKDLRPSIEAESEDEIGQLTGSLDVAVRTMRDLLETIEQGVETVSSASTELSLTADKNSDDARNECEKSTQIAHATQEMAASVAEVSQNAASATTASQEVAHAASAGGEAIARTVARIQGIHQSTSRTVEKMSTLNRRSNEIGSVVNTIREISEQTNLLALNAAIEAQRAGEHGRGFAVVAGEVRRLAERTKAATGEITGTIEAIQREAHETMNLIETGSGEVEAGLKETEDTRQKLDAIIQYAGVSEQQISLIASASTQQAAASSEISEAVSCISRASTEVSSAAQDTKQACHQLSQLSADLSNLISSFRFDSTSERTGTKAHL